MRFCGKWRREINLPNPKRTAGPRWYSRIWELPETGTDKSEVVIACASRLRYRDEQDHHRHSSPAGIAGDHRRHRGGRPQGAPGQGPSDGGRWRSSLMKRAKLSGSGIADRHPFPGNLDHPPERSQTPSEPGTVLAIPSCGSGNLSRDGAQCREICQRGKSPPRAGAERSHGPAPLPRAGSAASQQGSPVRESG